MWFAITLLACMVICLATMQWIQYREVSGFMRTQIRLNEEHLRSRLAIVSRIDGIYDDLDRIEHDIEP